MNECLALLSWLFMMLVVGCDYAFGVIGGNPETKKMVFKWLIAVTGLTAGVTLVFTYRACKTPVPAIVSYPLAIFVAIFAMIYLHIRIRFCDGCGAATYLHVGWPTFAKGMFFTDLEEAKREKSVCWKCKEPMHYE